MRIRRPALSQVLKLLVACSGSPHSALRGVCLGGRLASRGAASPVQSSGPGRLARRQSAVSSRPLARSLLASFVAATPSHPSQTKTVQSGTVGHVLVQAVRRRASSWTSTQGLRETTTSREPFRKRECVDVCVRPATGSRRLHASKSFQYGWLPTYSLGRKVANNLGQRLSFPCLPCLRRSNSARNGRLDGDWLGFPPASARCAAPMEDLLSAASSQM